MGKSILASIKTTSLPRLELNVVVEARICEIVKKEMTLPIITLKLWRDLMLTFKHVTDKSHIFKVYVANRVAEILKYTGVKNWEHVDGREYSADICTRGNIDPILD